MIDIRSASQLKGLWAAVPTPWTDAGELDTAALDVNIHRLAAIGADGIYTTDSDGEFYAMELPQFRDFVAVFAASMSKVNVGVQVGVTSPSTRGVIDRIQVCLDHGISTVHVGYPFWMPVNQRDMHRFWEDLAEAAPRARWVHYNTPRCHLTMGRESYRWLAEHFPEQFIGTKLASCDFAELCDIVGSTPDVAHFVVDFVVAPGMMIGARGTYSFWVNTLPTWHRRLMDLCRQGQWEQAMAMQRKFNRWELEFVAPLVGKGYLHGIIGKARGSLTDFLADSGYTKPPYYPVPQHEVDQLRAAFNDWWAQEAADDLRARSALVQAKP